MKKGHSWKEKYISLLLTRCCLRDLDLDLDVDLFALEQGGGM